MQSPAPQIQVEPTKVIDSQRQITGNIIAGLIHDLAVTTAALDHARDEADRLTRVNETLTGGTKPPNPSGHGE